MKKRLFASILALTMCGTGLSALAAEELAVQDETTTEMAEEAVIPAQGDGVEVTAPQEEQDIAAENGEEAITVQDDETAPNIVESGTCGEHAAWILDEDGTLTVSGTGDTAAPKDRSERWTNYKVKKIVIEEGITGIGDKLFSHDTFTDIEIPDSVTSIGSYAFDTCLDMTSFTIPKTVTHLGTAPFYDCRNLDSIVVDQDNPNYSSRGGVLYNKDKTVLLTVPCSMSGTYRMPSSVRTIEELAINSCSELTGIQLSKNLRTIKSAAFERSSGLTTLTIPSKVRSIAADAFEGCIKLKSFSVAGGNRTYTGVGGVLFSKDRHTLVAYPKGKRGRYAVPKGVTRIGDYAFCDCIKLTGVTLPNGLTEIGYRAFLQYRSYMHAMTIPKSVKTFGEQSVGYIWDNEGEPMDECYPNVLGFVIHGKPDSAAKDYAETNGFDFRLDTGIRGVKLSNLKGRKIAVTWNKNSRVDGYEIYYADNIRGKNPFMLTAKKNSSTIWYCAIDKWYYVQVRGYRKYSGKTYYTDWTEAKSIKITR